MLDVCYTQLVTRSIKVLTRHSTLAWMLNCSGLQGRLGRWAALLSKLDAGSCKKLGSAARTTGTEDQMERTCRAQNEEKWIADLKQYLTGDIRKLTSTEAKSCANIAEDYEVDEAGLLFYCPPSKQPCEDRDLVTRLVIPEPLQEDVLHHYHSSLEGGHQGIGRTYQRIRAHFHWRGLYRRVQQYVGQCVDCGKGRPTMEGESPGNLQATYPLQIIAMDHFPSLPKSDKSNTELLTGSIYLLATLLQKLVRPGLPKLLPTTVKSVCSVDLVPAR
ncbi:unnamed protein product [Phytophthora fragariaefolia]|uniref:Unnamed protein product n=1 Tax=Phytophthora fragariaefolia TaxID=1490495 RepID=A0A9W7CYM5_9STRA|nr:unnamed protein product [Phytophthora fragariaefolia]